MLLTPRRAGHPIRDAAAEHAAWMVVAAAESLATEADPSARARFSAIARGLLLALRSTRITDRAIREASPVLYVPDGTTRPIIDLVASHGEDPDSGVQAATVILLALAWREQSRAFHQAHPPTSRLRTLANIPARERSEMINQSCS